MKASGARPQSVTFSFAPRGAFPRNLRRIAVGAAMVALCCGCGGGTDVTTGPGSGPGGNPLFAVLGAFPAEAGAVVERADIEETMIVEGKTFRVGTLAGKRVVIAMTGIGLINAADTTRLLLANFDVDGVIVSAVAGSPYNIGDVSVPERWVDTDGGSYACDSAWLEVAKEVEVPGAVTLDRCTVPPSMPELGEVCMPNQPVVYVGGYGSSSDPFGGSSFKCRPEAVDDDVFGCDVVEHASSLGDWGRDMAHETPTQDDDPTAVDMETSAIAREVVGAGLPFIAFRAASDGAGDPLNLPGFPIQFFAYYRLAAENAAEAAAAFLDRL